MDEAGPDDDEFEGDLLAPLLTRPGGAAVAEALVGCRAYRSDPDQAEVILRLDATAGRLTVRRRDGREREIALRGAYVLSADGRLRGAVSGATTEEDRALARDLRAAATLGLTGRIEPPDAAAVADTVRAMARGELADEPARRRAAALARKYGDARTVLRLTTYWLRITGRRAPADVLIAHVRALREVGDVTAALAATDVLAASGHGLSLPAQAVLLTQRAALWLDVAERGADAEPLARARAWAGRAYAIAPSEELDAVYGRLRKLEAERRS